MRDETITTTGIAAHGASRLPWVEIDSFNLELKDEEGFLGDRANKAAFWELSKSGVSRCASLAKTRSGTSLPKTSARRTSTRSWPATTPRRQLWCTAPSRILRRNSPT